MTHMYTHMHTHMHTCTPTCTHAHMYTHMHTCTPTCTHVHPHANMYTHMHTCTPTCTYVHPRAHMYTHMHTCTSTCKHVHPHNPKVLASPIQLLHLKPNTQPQDQCANLYTTSSCCTIQAILLSNLCPQLTNCTQHSMDLAQEKGVSNWLTTLPIDENGFTLHKGAFRDAIALRYGWLPSNIPSTCTCGKSFTVEHALSCSLGGFPSIRQNEIRDLTANLMTEVCHNVSIEPHLQPITGETFPAMTANTEDGARSDIRSGCRILVRGGST